MKLDVIDVIKLGITHVIVEITAVGFREEVVMRIEVAREVGQTGTIRQKTWNTGDILLPASRVPVQTEGNLREP